MMYTKFQSHRAQLLAQQERDRADVVEVAVGDDDEVDVQPLQGREIGTGLKTGEFGVQAAVDHDADIAELEKVATGTDAAVAVEIEKFHSWEESGRSSGGGRADGTVDDG